MNSKPGINICNLGMRNSNGKIRTIRLNWKNRKKNRKIQQLKQRKWKPKTSKWKNSFNRRPVSSTN